MRKTENADTKQKVLIKSRKEIYRKSKIPEYFESIRNILVRMLKKLMENQKYDIWSKIDAIHSREENTIRSLLVHIRMNSHYKGLGVAGAAYNDTLSNKLVLSTSLRSWMYSCCRNSATQLFKLVAELQSGRRTFPHFLPVR